MVLPGLPSSTTIYFSGPGEVRLVFLSRLKNKRECFHLQLSMQQNYLTCEEFGTDLHPET